MSRFEIDDFSGGRDKRPRLFYGAKKNLWRELDNAFIDKDRKVHRRWPMRYQAGTLTGVLSAAVGDNGVLTYFAVRGTPAVVLGTIPTAVVQFDELPGHTADRVMWAEHFNGNIIALIRHQFLDHTGAALAGFVTYKLHVFDGAKYLPTYVEDPYFPTCWGPSRPLHLYRTGTLGTHINYTPRVGVAAGKVYISDAAGNVSFCAPNNARVWNTRTPTQLRDEGEWWYWDNYESFSPGDVVNTALSGRWLIPEDPAKLWGENGWTCYVLEYLDTTGTWQKFIQDPVGVNPSVNGHYQVISTAGRFGRAEFGVWMQIPAGATNIFRMRLIAGSPPIVVTSGGEWTDVGTRNPVNFTYEGTAYHIDTWGVFPALPSTVVSYLRLLLINAAGNHDGLLEYTHTANTAFPVAGPQLATLTGYDRYTNLIVGWSFGMYDGGGTLKLTYTSLNTFLAYTVSSSPTGFTYEISTLGNAFTTGNATPFFTERMGIQAARAGFGLAGFLPTATRAKRDGGPVTGLSVIRDYLGVHYRTLTLLYALNSNQLLDTIRDQSYFGTGPYTDGITTAFYSQTVLFSERGFRTFSISESAVSDRAGDTNIGEPNEVFSKTAILRNACFWPNTGQYVAIVDIGGTRYLYVFDYSRDSKISAWSRWTVGLTPSDVGPCGLVPINDRLYFVLSSGGVAYLDAGAAAGSFYDDVDTTGAVVGGGYNYVSAAEGYQNTLGSTATLKQISSVDVVSSGAVTVSFKVLQQALERPVPGFAVTGPTIGAKRALVSIRAAALAIRFVSTDRNGWILDSYAIDFRNLKR